MDELKSENKQKTENEFKPDTSDRRPSRSRNQSNSPKLAISRQQMMIGIGILVLLLLIIAISSALKSPTAHEKQQASSSIEKGINLSGSSSSSPNNQGFEQGEQPISPNQSIPETHEISPQPIKDAPSNDVPPATEMGGYNQRIELPGDISDALNQQQSSIDNSVQKKLVPPPVKPAQPTVTPPVEQKKPEKISPPKIEHKVREESQVHKKNVADTKVDLLKAPSNRFTLQLSSASRSDTLTAFAKNNNLVNYKVYQTKRDGKTWFILIHGNYNSISDAKNAISSLPADVQAKKPWVRKLQQVQQDLKK
ncbi:SPOR domain-containing protein [Xenorhabdus hominickii]|uniref:Membrane protein n=1 Tax=Xenorhabdus hominickii TaxID=351679 RepID=A0A2G0QF27_XENHO|nr:SPOR domain-containing protein [Xenorhabdus hominickii]AOM41839.1 hypothetical protein A9255_15510 [Xenorhabdus hominickii]PHM57808.1 membrane protein [Xenorhabdus hominickii]